MKIFGLDFDGTVVYNKYPQIGHPVPFALDVLRQINEHHHIILFTMRSGNALYDAEIFLKKHGIDLYGINVNPDQHIWTDSPKAFCHYYIDDRAIGTPLRPDGVVDWIKIEQILKSMELI